MRPRRPTVVAVVGPTATGKSALAIALALRLDGEIVSCDSTAVYRGFDIGTDKVARDERQGVPHHLVDIVDPSDTYSAARYARDAAAVIHDIASRGRLPIITGGTGLYYRALTRGVFPGPARDDRLRQRFEAMARRHGVERLHRWLRAKDPASGARVLPRDLKRIVRALEVLHLTGRPMSDHFADTRSPLEGHEVVTLALSLPADLVGERVARRVDAQFARGLVDEVRALLAAGVPQTAHPFTGLVYKQVLEYLHGARDEAATRALIVQENRRYARRQLIWFRKEPNLLWLHEPGEARSTIEHAMAALRGRGVVREMSQVNQKPPVAAPNIQDGFLNHARRDRTTMLLRLMDGTSFDARIKNFDKFAIIVELDGADVMIFKHAIASIRSPRAAGSASAQAEP